MDFLNFTDGDFMISPINKNLVISDKTQECIAIVMYGKHNGLCFPVSRDESRANAELIARSKKMYNFLMKLHELIPKNNNTSAFGNTFNEYVDDEHTIGEMIEELLKA